jgi:hypothetical protein
MFYGRLLAGRRTGDGAFTANHSFYDSSCSAEYWGDAAASCRSYPWFPGLEARVRCYPVMSPGRLALSIEAHGSDGRTRARWDAGEIESPGAGFVEIDLGGSLARARVDRRDVATFTVRAQPVGGLAPTRINHQVLYGRGGLFASLNVSLSHPSVFVPAGKTGFAWGQIPVGGSCARGWVSSPTRRTARRATSR